MNQKYNLVDTVEKLKQLDQILMDGDKPRYPVLSVDTETNGLFLYRATVVGFSVSFNKDTGYYIPLLKWVPDKNSLKKRRIDKKAYSSYMRGCLECVWTGERFDEFVKPSEYDIGSRFPLIPALAQRWFKSTKLFMWNAPFDVNMFYTNFILNGTDRLDLSEDLFIDGSLMTHILNENESVALKPTAERYKAKLGINPHAMAAQEKAELIESIRRNGGKKVEVWRADIDVQSKYACADTFLTHGLCEVAMDEFSKEFGQEGIKWFLEDEVMPLCKEVTIRMKRRGVYTNVNHFKKLHEETKAKMDEIEDRIISLLNQNKYLVGFNIGKDIDEAVSNQALIKAIIDIEKLPHPRKFDKKENKWKDTLAKPEVRKLYDEEPHWLWGYILGEDEIKYTDAKLSHIKQSLYEQKENKRYRFNIRSDDHLRWLFCDKLGFSKTSLPQTDSATKDNPIPSMKAEVLKDYMLPKHDWVKDLLLYKKLQKLYSSYISSAVELHLDGWLYMDMKQNGTKSGRFSCSGGFNLQTLPKVEEIDRCPKCKSKNLNVSKEIELLATIDCQDCGYHEEDILCPSAIKEGFIAPPGYKIVNSDYSSLEPRCFAYMSGDEKIKAVYKEGLDLYSQVYCTMFPDGKDYSANPDDENFLKKQAPEKRSMVKPIVLGIPYGSSAYQVASMCGYTREIVDRNTGNTRIIPDTERGAELRDLYLATFQNLHAYMKNQERMAVEEGYVKTIVGRKRHFQYAKNINDILKRYDIDYRDIVDAPPKELKKDFDITYVSNRGIQVTLSKKLITEIKEALRLDWDKFYLKGRWNYVRNLIKADINEACNNPIQGLAAHITNRGMLDTTRLYGQNDVDGWVCLQVHDEITSYVREDHLDKAVSLKKIGMEDNIFTKLIDIPMVADPIVCNTLKESK